MNKRFLHRGGITRIRDVRIKTKGPILERVEAEKRVCVCVCVCVWREGGGKQFCIQKSFTHVHCPISCFLFVGDLGVPDVPNQHRDREIGEVDVPSTLGFPGYNRYHLDSSSVVLRLSARPKTPVLPSLHCDPTATAAPHHAGSEASSSIHS